MEKVKKVLLAYLKTQFVLMLITTLAVWLALQILGVRLALLLAVFTGAVSIVPNLGILVASVVVSLTAIFDGRVLWSGTSSVWEGVVVFLLMMMINKIIDLLVAPMFVGKVGGVNGWLMLGLVTLGTLIFGFWGALLTAPVVLAVKTIFEGEPSE